MQITSSSVVVITGASSGIGRATAIELAKRGARIAVAARRRGPLESLASECEHLGASAVLVAPTDVTDKEAVNTLAAEAARLNGGIDAWINNAGVYAVGRFEEIPAASFDRVIETNVIGYANGARAVLPFFRRQSRGTLINVISINGHVPGPLVSPYTASKWALYGFTEALRQELRDAKDIHIAAISPAAIDTPIWQHGANYSGREVKALHPLSSPRKVAAAIVQQIENPHRESIVGRPGRLVSIARRVAPATVDRMMAQQVSKEHFGEGEALPTDGNLFEPMDAGDQVSGGWSN